jgi:hypothetical protein
MIQRRKGKKVIRQRRHPNNKIDFLAAIENLIDEMQTDHLFVDSADQDEDLERNNNSTGRCPSPPNVTPVRRTHVKPRRLFKNNIT